MFGGRTSAEVVARTPVEPERVHSQLSRCDSGAQAALRVALKLVRGDLAALEHRERLLLERVEGEPLDRYRDLHRLPVEERLALFAQVCAAVQYAHQHLVVHRDLKPGNILVDARGTVKLLDLGIELVVGQRPRQPFEGGLGRRWAARR